MFLHFGVNTFGNVEWSDGGIAARSYQPTAIDADQWVRAAYEAGMNFVVLTAKHHEGFCLWHTKQIWGCIIRCGTAATPATRRIWPATISPICCAS